MDNTELTKSDEIVNGFDEVIANCLKKLAKASGPNLQLYTEILEKTTSAKCAFFHSLKQVSESQVLGKIMLLKSRIKKIENKLNSN